MRLGKPMGGYTVEVCWGKQTRRPGVGGGALWHVHFGLGVVFFLRPIELTRKRPPPPPCPTTRIHSCTLKSTYLHPPVHAECRAALAVQPLK